MLKSSIKSRINIRKKISILENILISPFSNITTLITFLDQNGNKMDYKMQDKRYQVFISSTYRDLAEERKAVTEAILAMEHIPAGMELFPAFDEDQFSFIKRIIDDSDYYVLIIGGRYGSVDENGISYTEKEFDYAVSKGIKVIAMIHRTPENIPQNKIELDKKLRQKLETFINKVSNGRVVDYWSSAEELKFNIGNGLNKITRIYPANGWVRGSSHNVTDLLSQVNDLRDENDALKKEIEILKNKYKSEKQSIDDNLNLNFKLIIRDSNKPPPNAKVARIKAKEIFLSLAHHLPIKEDFYDYSIVNNVLEILELSGNYEIDRTSVKEIGSVFSEWDIIRYYGSDRYFDFGITGRKYYMETLDQQA